MKPRITIVTPVYNGVDLLEDCIASILGQEYSELEYGIVDGGSTDGTLDVIRRYESRLAFWMSEPDEGQADAVNKGFCRATGDLVAWLNADDFYYPGALETVAEAYVADPQAVFYFGNGFRVDREGRKLSEFFPGGQVMFRRDALVFGLNYILQPATFIRRSAIEQIGFLDAKLHYGFDTDAWLRLSRSGRPRAIRKSLAASREYAETKTATGSFKRAEELRRIAERHAYVAATPGSVSYYLDTLHRLAAERSDVFPREYVKSIETFWAATGELMWRYGARTDGFPLPRLGRPDEMRVLPRLKEGRLRVGIELRYATRGASGGIVPVLVGTLRELFLRRQDVDFVVYCTVFNRELLSIDAPNVEVLTLPLGGFFRDMSQLTTSLGIDVLFRSYPTVEQVGFPLSRQIFLVPDVQHMFHPEFFDAATLRAREAAFRTALEGAGAIMTISEFAQRTIHQHAPAEREIFVARPSVPQDFSSARSSDATEAERALVPTGEFFFYPANLWPHKNHDRVLEAFRRFRECTGSRAEFVLTGSPAGWSALRERHSDLPVHHLGYVSSSLLKLLYERALALAFFSLYEGFGIPVLEAFEAGTPVLCSDTTSLPEVAGDAALLGDPEDIEQIATLFERIAASAQLRSELVSRGKERARAFAWQDGAQELASAIERVRKQSEAPTVGALPLVSLVTPSYNQGRFIRHTIESVLAQTYPNIDYVVVDGASTDDTLEILESFGDRLRWISEPDAGQAAAINKGMRLVSGQIVGYLNSDDVLLPRAIEEVVRHFQQHPECDLVYGDAEYIDDQGAVISRYATADYSFERLMEDCCICQPAAYWRAAGATVVGPFDETLDFAMDYDYWIRFDRAGLVIQHLPVTIARSRLHEEAKTLRARRQIYHEIFRVCLDRGGYISQSYVHGLWDQVVNERGRGTTGRRRARVVPAALARVHYVWLNRHLLFSARGRPSIRSRLAHRLEKAPRLLAAALRARSALASIRSRTARRHRQTLRVRGFWRDNWIADRLDVVVDASNHARKLKLVGRPVADMSVRVSSNEEELARFRIEGGREEALTVELPAGPREHITFAFSERAVDADGRPLSFLLQETNLFREDDLHRLG